MTDKLLLLLAYDTLLLELDPNYEQLPDEVANMLQSKIYESYGLELTSSSEDAQFVLKSMFQDALNNRDRLLKELMEEEN